MSNGQKHLTLLMDLYELTMAQGYFENGMENQVAYFDYYFRKVPDEGGFAIFCGLEPLIQALETFHFNETDLIFLSQKGLFNQTFIDYLRHFTWRCDIWSVAEGTPVFPNEPLLIVKGPMLEAQIIETLLLVILNHQSLICTKANRIVRSAGGRAVIEFGARRAHGGDAAVLGARSAYIGGCEGTSNMLADLQYGVPSSGTMAHSWVQMFEDEYAAFTAYTELYPDSTVLLVDTFDVMQSGIPNAIRAFDEVLKPLGKKPVGIRIDSGDIAYLSKAARQQLDKAGYQDCKIFASNALDEYIIRDMIYQGACIDAFGVGERLITSKTTPVFGGVYKLVALEKEGVLVPKIKLSENVDKITTPGFKQVWRLYDQASGKALADVVTLHHEDLSQLEVYELFDPSYTWKRKKIKNFTAQALLKPIFEEGLRVYPEYETKVIRQHATDQLSTLWEEVKRFENPHRYFIDLSADLWTLKQEMIDKMKGMYIKNDF
jgi:nicotinate phosphoribosyltransferase